MPLNKVRDKIQDILAGRKQKTAYENWMKELKDSAFIEISLFNEPKKNLISTLSKFKKKREKASGLKIPKSIQKGKEERPLDKAEKKKMQDMWEKMYKSIEKSKNRDPKPSQN